MQLQKRSEKPLDHSADALGHTQLTQSRIKRSVLIAVLAINLGGCSFASDTLFASLLGDESVSQNIEPMESAALNQMPAQA